jgi:hypothetical protein
VQDFDAALLSLMLQEVRQGDADGCEGGGPVRSCFGFSMC